MYHLREMVDAMRRAREIDGVGAPSSHESCHVSVRPESEKVRPGTLQEALFRGGLSREHIMDVVRRRG
jgi:hypothetical protein